MGVDILKTWPGFMTRAHTRRIFSHPFGLFYFSVGRGLPQRLQEKVPPPGTKLPLYDEQFGKVYRACGPPARLYFTHHGRILGSFQIAQLVRNEGQLPKLHSLDGEPSEWQIKWLNWVCVCPPPFTWLKGRPVYHQGFRGWRYFDLETYRNTIDAKVRF